ncbi:MAG: hypothetical protein AB4911_15920 [Oscillochloridaceae bacterium umkhey_bin13]
MIITNLGRALHPLLIITGLLSLILGMLNPAYSAVAPPAMQPLAQTDAWEVNWSITATGTANTTTAEQRQFAQRTIMVSGSATVHRNPAGAMLAEPFYLTVSDDREEFRDRLIGKRWERTVYRQHLIDPGRWMGGPDPFWVGTFAFTPQQGSNGIWSLPTDLFDLGFFVNGSLARTYTYRTETIFPDEPSLPREQELSLYANVLLNQLHDTTQQLWHGKRH